jgi:hypothetical protein
LLFQEFIEVDFANQVENGIFGVLFYLVEYKCAQHQGSEEKSNSNAVG